MKVDLVYTWVDSNDPRWRADKTFWNKICGNKESSNNCRFFDNEELRYSLRSANMNVPWVNHIFIITDRQVPYWLDTNHPKITIVDHSEILPPEVIPTFNSLAIETALDKIPQLNEHFLYANDDMFFFNPVSESFFFDHNQTPYVRFCRMKEISELRDIQYFDIICKTFEVYKSRYNTVPDLYSEYTLGHQVDPYRKSYLKECRENFENEFYLTAKTKFRQSDSILRIIYNYFMADRKRCVIKEIPNAKETFQFRQPEFVNVVLEAFEWFANSEFLSNGYPKLLCVNDNENADEASRKKIKPLFEKLFSEPAEWEF